MAAKKCLLTTPSLLSMAVNRALGEVVDEGRVETWFEREWPALEKKLEAIPAKVAAAPHVDEKKIFEQVWIWLSPQLTTARS